MIDFLLDRLPDQDIESHLLTIEGEEVIDLVRHHPIVYARPFLEAVGIIPLWLLAVFGPIQLGWRCGLGPLVSHPFGAGAVHRRCRTRV